LSSISAYHAQAQVISSWNILSVEHMETINSYWRADSTVILGLAIWLIQSAISWWASWWVWGLKEINFFRNSASFIELLNEKSFIVILKF
jgi:hypothetical protein